MEMVQVHVQCINGVNVSVGANKKAVKFLNTYKHK
jgi:hypothetical protein